MTKASVIGTTFETKVVEYINTVAKKTVCERRAKHGNLDKGDILIYDNPTFVVECKAEKKFTLADYVKELEVEIQNAGGKKGIVVLKNPRKSIGDAYVIIPLRMFVERWGFK